MVNFGVFGAGATCPPRVLGGSVKNTFCHPLFLDIDHAGFLWKNRFPNMTFQDFTFVTFVIWRMVNPRSLFVVFSFLSFCGFLLQNRGSFPRDKMSLFVFLVIFGVSHFFGVFSAGAAEQKAVFHMGALCHFCAHPIIRGDRFCPNPGGHFWDLDKVEMVDFCPKFCSSSGGVKISRNIGLGFTWGF